MSEPTWPVVVVGAGAAGLWAAARTAERGVRTLLLEKTPRTGTKVLASGGTRCNLTTTLGPEAAAHLFGPAGARFLRTAFRTLPPLAVRRRFHELGVPTVEAPLEKVFPRSQRARDVRDALEGWARSSGVDVRTRAPVAGLEVLGTEGFRLALAGGEAVRARRLILAAGGMSVPRTGTTGEGYAWLRRLGLEVVPPTPALVPLVSPAAWVRELAGIAWPAARVRAIDARGRVLARRDRPVLFTHRGLSGPGAMDVSWIFARREIEGGELPKLKIDLVPDRPDEGLRESLVAGRPGRGRLERWLATELELPRRLARAVLSAAGVPLERRGAELRRDERHRLVAALKGLEVPIEGTLGFEHAEVTAGGLALGELAPGSLEVRRHPGLFVCGELLDLFGPIGGLNFQAAFATAELAARAAAR